MSRYPWHDAPDWAQYATTDADGASHWHESEPVRLSDCGELKSDSRYAPVCMLTREEVMQSLAVRIHDPADGVYPWSEAPPWAQYAARDTCGRATWYARRPVYVFDERSFSRHRPSLDDARSAPVRWAVPTFEARPAPPMYYPWDIAPAWAQYAAIDASGKAYWYAKRPTWKSCQWQQDVHVQFAPIYSTASQGLPEPHLSLQPRPCVQATQCSQHGRYPWDIAPAWAQYAATDASGDAYWYENKPNFSDAGVGKCEGRFVYIEAFATGADSLEARPK